MPKISAKSPGKENCFSAKAVTGFVPLTPDPCHEAPAVAQWVSIAPMSHFESFFLEDRQGLPGWKQESTHRAATGPNISCNIISR